MSNNVSPEGFQFNLAIPVSFPTSDTIDSFPIHEPHMNHLINGGYMTKEEAVAYVIFQTMAASIPTMMDEFLRVYRGNKAELENPPVPPASKIILPTR